MCFMAVCDADYLPPFHDSNVGPKSSQGCLTFGFLFQGQAPAAPGKCLASDTEAAEVEVKEVAICLFKLVFS